ncbi:MAG: cofactor-independent phosphoglycerate mutase [Planctomycetaceae bacterium]|nr:cofactor-independent phosphoglycerate mutase [Planctomycetaceae bacterium]
MKYAIIIPDGAADVPQVDLGGRTPLEAASMPNAAWIARHGKCGQVANVPEGMEPGSDVATMSVLGYNPSEYHTGRAPIEAAARGLDVGPDQWVVRCNLVTIIDGVMIDHSAGHISTEEAAEIIAQINDRLGSDAATFYAGVSYRHLLVLAGELAVHTTAPHDILGQKADDYLPKGKGAKELTRLIKASRELLANHEINDVRADLRENPATSIWLWGQGKMPSLPSFRDRFGLSGAVVAAVDLVRGLARLIGWDCINVKGATGYLDTDYAGKGAAAVAALADHDVVCVHIEAPDEAGHQGDAKAKVHALEMIDHHIIGRVVEHLRGQDTPWRVLVLPDHPTPCTIRTHTADPVPFAMAGLGIDAVRGASFTETAAQASDLFIPRGCDLMEFFLTVR